MEQILVRELRKHQEFDQALDIFQQIWSFEPGAEPVSAEMLLAFSHFGNYVSGAFLGERMVGASVGFRCAPEAGGFVSHMTGAVQGKGVGTALKRHQRGWALARGITRIVWTFDPLVRRNAQFNLVKLGASVTAYLPNFYGDMADGINAGDESDRLCAAWDLTSPGAIAAAAGEFTPVFVAQDAESALVSRDGWPERRETSAATVLVQTPEDIEAVRTVNPLQAAAWRKELRETLGALMEDGAAVLGFHGRSSYVVQRRAHGR
ncbi:GNAT family N-acetyltransferase [Actinocorallia sp. A-T 12471]|uniref:GNAT family N-acetyltransferase n=1 Tax=Actinocorallia sp. A-T 12471 TaxID=3089813 RepID=UPI0029CE6E55|nr:GNAT family N-acetyltransferase [Actinocorallia sp. A-T 12471]MDX6739813.1 GNAT family N-acetyltransferase [Actinocorallia sp. A-T 12471]